MLFSTTDYRSVRKYQYNEKIQLLLLEKLIGFSYNKIGSFLLFGLSLFYRKFDCSIINIIFLEIFVQLFRVKLAISSRLLNYARYPQQISREQFLLNNYI